MKSIKRKIKLVSLFTVLLFLFELFSPVFYEMLQAELYMSVSGKISDKVTGAAVERAKVVIMKSENDQITHFDFVLSNKEGRYLFDVVPPGVYWLFVTPPKDSGYALDLSPKVIQVSKGKNIINMNVELVKGGSISGRALQKDGLTPLVNAQVLAISFTMPDSFGLGKTDNDGAYKINNLKEGNDYYVLVTPESVPAIFRKGMHVLPGQTIQNVDILLSDKGSANLSGSITDKATSMPIKNTFVILTKLGDGGFGRTAENGMFHLTNMEGGEYSILIIAPGYQLVESNILLSANAEKNVDFKLESIPSLKGQNAPFKVKHRGFGSFSEGTFFNSAVFAVEPCVSIGSCILNPNTVGACVPIIIACGLFGWRYACPRIITPILSLFFGPGVSSVGCLVGVPIVCGTACIIGWILECR